MKKFKCFLVMFLGPFGFGVAAEDVSEFEPKGLKLSLVDVRFNFVEGDGDSLVEPGETISISFQLLNRSKERTDPFLLRFEDGSPYERMSDEDWNVPGLSGLQRMWLPPIHVRVKESYACPLKPKIRLVARHEEGEEQFFGWSKNWDLGDLVKYEQDLDIKQYVNRPKFEWEEFSIRVPESKKGRRVFFSFTIASNEQKRLELALEEAPGLSKPHFKLLSPMSPLLENKRIIIGLDHPSDYNLDYIGELGMGKYVFKFINRSLGAITVISKVGVLFENRNCGG